MLSDRIKQIPDIKVVGDSIFKFPCHTAACYWLYEEAFGTAPGIDVITSDTFLNTTGVMTALAKKHGSKLKPSAAENIAPGMVLILTSSAGIALHTCVIRTDSWIGGYNQFGWFEGGMDHNFSIHEQKVIRWRPSGSKHSIFLKIGDTTTEGHLMGVTDKKAVGFMKDKYGQKF